jgi:hypothetical protein
LLAPSGSNSGALRGSKADPQYSKLLQGNP